MLAIQETKLNNSNRDSEFYIPGFELVRRERIIMAVVFFVSILNLVLFFARNDLNIADLDNVCIEVRKPQSKALTAVKQGIGHQIPLLDCIHTLSTLSEN